MVELAWMPRQAVRWLGLGSCRAEHESESHWQGLIDWLAYSFTLDVTSSSPTVGP